MKIIFVTNDISYYGASRSLKALIEALKDKFDKQLEIKLIVPKRLFRKNDLEQISLWFKIEKKDILEFPLPFYNNYKGNSKSLFHFIFNLKWRLFSLRFYNFLKKENFDIVHLNSLTLLRVCHPSFNMLLHVREILANKLDFKFIQDQLKYVERVIFIDEAVSSPFKDFSIKKQVILNNPFSMTHLENYNSTLEDEELIEKCRGKTVFSLIGKIHREKGIEFFIDIFNRLDSDEQILIVKGGGDSKYVKFVKGLAGKNIYFLDESPAVDGLYRITDYLLRGEEYPCIGRTTFEALYSGAKVILPGSQDYYAGNMTDFNRFNSSIITYMPRNFSHLLNIIKTIEKTDKQSRQMLSNTEEYATAYFKFIRK